MRTWLLGLSGVVFFVAIGAKLLFAPTAPVALSALVPEDAPLAVLYQSVNRLRAVFPGKQSELREDAGRLFVGLACNNPDLDGVDFDRPVARFLTRDLTEVTVVPVRHWESFLAAFDRSRENLRLRKPSRVGEFASVSATGARATPGRDDALVVAGLESPVSIVGRPRDPVVARLILGQGLLLNDAQIAALPQGLLPRFVAECDRFVLGATPGEGEKEAAVLRATLHLREGLLTRAGTAAGRVEVASLLALFPAETLLFVAGALTGSDLEQVAPAPAAGDAACALGLVRTTEPRRPFTLLLAVRPADPARLRALDAAGPSLLWPDASEAIAWTALQDGDTTVRTAPLPHPPPLFARAFRPLTPDAPELQIATAVEGGVFYLAAGTRAQSVIRTALACARGERALSLLSSVQVSAHPALQAKGVAFLGLVTEPGLRALDLGFPSFRLIDIGIPLAATFAMRIEGPAKLEVRLSR